MPTLILTPRFTEDAQALWRAAMRLGWDVERWTSWRVPDELRSVSDPVLYLESLFGPTLADQFGLRLLEPAADWLPRLPEEYRKRRVALSTLREARSLPGPAFIKPPNDKSFPARAYRGAELPDGYDEDSPVLVAEVVTWEKEFRCFVLDRELRTLSIYLRNGELQRESDFAVSDEEMVQAEAFIRTVLADQRVDLSKTAVPDVGVISGRGWAVVEQNAALGIGLVRMRSGGGSQGAATRRDRHPVIPRPGFGWPGIDAGRVAREDLFLTSSPEARVIHACWKTAYCHG